MDGVKKRAGLGTRSFDGLAKFGQVRKGCGPKPTIPQDKIDEIVELTTNSTPDGQTHWLCRSMAKRVGVSKDTVQRCGPHGV